MEKTTTSQNDKLKIIFFLSVLFAVLMIGLWIGGLLVIQKVRSTMADDGLVFCPADEAVQGYEIPREYVVAYNEIDWKNYSFIK
jgi:hypothetical protein